MLLPATQREVALKGCHYLVGHLGLECMLNLMCDQFFWPHIAAQAKEHIRKCCPCFAFKAKQPKAPLENIVATHPLELVHLNYLCLEPGKGLEENVLVVTDHFARYMPRHMSPRPKLPKLLPKPHGTSLLSTMGYPKRSCLTKAEIFKSQLVADLSMLMGMQKIQTSLCHPQTNSQCERLNSTLINMLGMLPLEKKSEWKNHIGMLVHAYNYTQNSAMGFSPYYLMYRRQPHLPIDVTFGIRPQNTMASNTSKFIQKIRDHAKWACKKAKAFHAKEAQCHKKNYDK